MNTSFNVFFEHRIFRESNRSREEGLLSQPEAHVLKLHFLGTHQALAEGHIHDALPFDVNMAFGQTMH
jgi:hypothetical protein